MADQWSIGPNPWWDMHMMAVRFEVRNGGDSFPCAITRIAINDHFETEDSQASAFINFEANPEWVLERARQSIAAGDCNPRGVFIIRSELSTPGWL